VLSLKISTYQKEPNQERQCTCNVILRRVHETTVAVVSSKYYIFLRARACVCVCVFVGECKRLRASEWTRACACARVALSMRHAKSMRHYLWPLWLHRIFRLYLINDTIFGKTVTENRMCLWFSLKLLFEKIIFQRIFWPMLS
jgi:hypothetical protein